MSPTSNSIHYHFSRKSNQILSYENPSVASQNTKKKISKLLQNRLKKKKKSLQIWPLGKTLILYNLVSTKLVQPQYYYAKPCRDTMSLHAMCLCFWILFQYKHTHTHIPHEFCTQLDPTHLSCLGFSVSSLARPFLISCFKYSTHP